MVDLGCSRASYLAAHKLDVGLEQGLGDMIQFIRYAPLVKKRGGKVVVECPDILLQLFSSVAGVDQLVAEGKELPAFDVHAPLMSLPYLLRTRLETVPAG